MIKNHAELQIVPLEEVQSEKYGFLLDMTQID